MPSSSLASPCNKVCALDEQTGLCRGCYRTLDEIARWGEMTDPERSQVLARLTARRIALPIFPEQAIPDRDSANR